MGVTGVMPLYFNNLERRTGFVTGVIGVMDLARRFLVLPTP